MDSEETGEEFRSPLDDEREPVAAGRAGDVTPTRSVGDGSPRLRLVTFVASAIAVIAVVVAGWALLRSGPADQDGSLEGARRVAVEFGAAYLTFDAASVDLAGDEMLALATDRFAEEFRNDRLPSVSQLFADSSTSTRAEVTETFLGPTIDGRTRVVVLVDVDATAVDGAQRLVNLSFVVELVDEDVGWRVDGVTPFPVPEVLEPSDPGTTTTAPGSPTTPTTGAAATTAPTG